MIALIAVAAWIFALMLVAALCVGARRGDRALLEDRSRAHAHRGQPAAAPAAGPSAPATGPAASAPGALAAGAAPMRQAA